jgi:GT2 family glycosyltransferase
VIVDNKSTDDSITILLRENINIEYFLILSEKNEGYAKGNNLGLKYICENTSCKYCFVCNPDIIINKGSIEKSLLNFKEFDKCAIVGGQMYDFNNRKSISAWRLPNIVDDIILSSSLLVKFIGNPVLYKSLDKVQKVDVIQGAFFAMKLDFLKEINFFDPGTFLYGEERILAYKLKKNYYNSVFDPEISFGHSIGKSINKKYSSNIKTFNLLSNSRYYYYKNIRKKKMHAYFFFLFSKIFLIEKVIISFYLKIRK